MVDYKNARILVGLREHRLKARRSLMQATKLDATAARMYSDDEDIQRGALSAPHEQYRPGQRDDKVYATIRRFSPAL